MTKNELLTAGMELIAASTTDKKKTKEALAEAFQALLAEYKGSKTKAESTAVEKIIERDGVSYTWCTRHQQYELSSGFKLDKDGKPDAMCDIALVQWRSFSAQISKMEKQTMDFIDDVEALRAHVAAINELKVQRASTNYDRTGVEGALAE